jgi:hypothetical protein
MDNNVIKIWYVKAWTWIAHVSYVSGSYQQSVKNPKNELAPADSESTLLARNEN